MTYYHLPTASERNPRAGEQTIDTGQWITPYNGQWTDTEAAACGFLPIVTTTRPADTATTTVDRSIVIDGRGRPVETWTRRPWTDGELAERNRPDPVKVALADIRAQVTADGKMTALLSAIEGGTLAGGVTVGPKLPGAIAKMLVPAATAAVTSGAIETLRLLGVF